MTHWTDHVAKETSTCSHCPDKTWLRHHPTQVVVNHWGRSDAVTYADLAGLLASHGMLSVEEMEEAYRAVPLDDPHRAPNTPEPLP